LPDGRVVEPSAWGGKRHHGTHDQDSSPDIVVEHGLPARGPNIDLREHILQYKDRAFRGSTSDPGAAAEWAGNEGWIYVIDGTPTWDVNKELDGFLEVLPGYREKVPTRGELEHAMLASVPRERIRGYFK